MFKNKITAVIAAVIIVILTVACVFAYQAMRNDDTVNSVTAEKLNARIVETLSEDEKIKESIVITADSDNTDNMKVRVALVACYRKNNNENIICPKSAPDLSSYINTEYWVPTTFTTDESGMYSDVYYVYKNELEPGESTENLLVKGGINLSECTYEDADGNVWVLEIDVLMQGADPETFEGSVVK